MWKLKVAEGGSPWLRTINNHLGRQVWEFDPELGSPEDLAEIEKVRENYRDNRSRKKHSSDLFMRMQVNFAFLYLTPSLLHKYLAKSFNYVSSCLLMNLIYVFIVWFSISLVNNNLIILSFSIVLGYFYLFLFTVTQRVVSRTFMLLLLVNQDNYIILLGKNN